MSEPKSNFRPRVSIIVPVHNGQKCITGLLESLFKLDYPRELTEVIIVDNMSSDNTSESIKGYPVVLLEENLIQSPYAARNRGIAEASGEVIAFTDADCVVSPAWIAESLQAMESAGSDMVAGRIAFNRPAQPTLAQIYDSLEGMRNDYYVAEMQGAITANLLVKSKLFLEIGGFYGSFITGEDLRWTQRAVKGGARLVYCPKAVIYHPPRKLWPLLKKRYRDGHGYIHIRVNMGLSLKQVFKSFLPSWVCSGKTYRYPRPSIPLWARPVYSLVVNLCKAAFFAGVLSSLSGLKEKNFGIGIRGHD